MTAGLEVRALPGASLPEHDDTLRVRALGIDTFQAPVVYMRADCAVCRAEGFGAPSRILVRCGEREIVATLHVVHSELLAHGEAGFSTSAIRLLDVVEGAVARMAPAPPLESLHAVRGKLYGHRFTAATLGSVIGEIAQGRYTDIDLAAFISACAGDRMTRDETLALTRAMVEVGERLRWSQAPIADKHCVGGLPGNRTTLLVVPIVASAGLTMPKTSSRAITSPAGTADAMETLAPVELDLAAMRRVVEQEGACIVWGGAVGLSPADDLLIRVERPLDIDSDAQLVASVLSKKLAAGATHTLVDLPVGPTAKVRSPAAADRLTGLLVDVATALGLSLRVVRTDGRQPIGRGIGPALEARDVLAVLERRPSAPQDLRERAVLIAGSLLELCGASKLGAGIAYARTLLDDGSALAKFLAICDAQGGLRTPPVAAHSHVLTAATEGVITAFDNRRLARAAKLAGAPRAPAAGIEVHVRLGAIVSRGQPIVTLHAQSPGELRYALSYVQANLDIVEVGAQ